MYRGFNLESIEVPDSFFEIGHQLHSQHKALVKSVLDEFITPSGALDASKMQANWFPSIKSHVFISHSHRDERTAISLAGWLKSLFSIEAFVDSCAWGFSDELLRLIDYKFCYDKESDIYFYEQRNRSTSHVHMMLSSALMMMIDTCECIFFLNTPSSLLPKDSIGNSRDNLKTKSPWIYFEIAATQFMRKRSEKEHRGIKEAALSKSLLDREMNFLYNINLNHLTDLSIDVLNNWLKKKDDYRGAEGALDALYELMPSSRHNKILYG